MPEDPPSDKFDRFEQSVEQQVRDEPDRGVQRCTPSEPKVRLRISVCDWGFAQDPSALYELEVAGETHRDGIGPSGVIDHLVPESVKTATLTVWPKKAEGVEPHSWELDLGTLTPVELETGARGRLANLMFDGEAGEAATPPELEVAVKDFQRRFELGVSGELDPATKRKLESVYDTGESVEETQSWIPKPRRPPPPRRR